MPGKVAVADNAGVFTRIIDKSQVAADLSPNALFGAFAINSERGFMGQIYTLANGIADRIKYFGAKDWRTRGRSLHDLDKYLESSQPAYAVRAGYVDPNSGLISEHNKLAALDFYPYPKMSGQFLVNMFNKAGSLLIDAVDSHGVGNCKVSLARRDDENPEISIDVRTEGDYKATIEINNMGIFDKKNLTITKNNGHFLLSDSYSFDKDKIVIDGLTLLGKPSTLSVEGNGYQLSGYDVDGDTKVYPSNGTSLAYDPAPYLFSSLDTNSWWIDKNAASDKAIDTGIAVLSGDAPKITKTGFVDDSGRYLDDVDNIPVDSKDTVAIPSNIVITGLRKLVKSQDGGYEYIELSPRDMRSIFTKKMSAELAESLAVIISTQDDHIELGVGESITFDDGGKEVTLLLDKDEFGYLQTSNTGYRQLEINPRLFKEQKAIATIFARGEGKWGNNIEVTISQKPFKFVASYGVNAIYQERADGTGLPILYRNAVNGEKWVKNETGPNTDEKFFGKFSEEDGPRIFSITIKDTLTGVAELYENVSFNPRDVDGSGNSIYIADVLSRSNLVDVVVNEQISDSGYEPAVDIKNVWVLPVAETNKVLHFSETKKLGGGRDLNVNIAVDTWVPGINTPSELDDKWTEINRSESFKAALNKILEAWLTHDSFLAFNAGQEISNPVFADLIASSNGGNPRVLGLTAIPLGQAMEQDRLPADIPEGEGGPSGGVATCWVAKYNQWILGADADAGQQIYTSPVGWIGKIIGINAANGMLPYAPAGYRRGILHGAYGLSRQWIAKQRLGVVEYGWNPIKYDPTAGYVVWDALTSQPLKSALSDIHVILSYQAIRRGIERTLKGFEFEFNDEATVKTMLNLLQGMVDGYLAQNYAEQIVIDAAENTYGSDQIRIRWHMRPKGVARTIVCDILIYPASLDISVSMAG